ncbi:MAG: hypothetical protein JWN34_3089 [Bryobacterales bacterium]|nr:hypothetical protein [Bryobacterales bacterium]
MVRIPEAVPFYAEGEIPNGHQRPQSRVDVRCELRRDSPSILNLDRAFPNLSVQHAMQLRNDPGRGPDRRHPGGQIPHFLGPRFIQIEFCDICGIEVHYRSRSSSIMRVLSGVLGSRSQISFISAKILALASGVIILTGGIARNSATGRPSSSITIASPSSTSRINSDVRSCNSSIVVERMPKCTPASKRKRGGRSRPFLRTKPAQPTRPVQSPNASYQRRSS